MIIERWEFKIKPGYLEEAKNLMLSMDWGRPYRLRVLSASVHEKQSVMMYHRFKP